LPKEGMVYRAMLWSSSTNIFTRVKISEYDPISVAVIDWFEGKLKEDLVSENRKEIYLPLEKGGHKLAMIVIKKLVRSFDVTKLLLVNAISSHLSVAFDNARLYSIAITDELTGLYSRRHLRHIISREFDKFKERGEKITILMLDLDDFKKINDTYGHIVGDNVLRDLGRSILDSVKQNDISFRYGVEEFVVLLPATDIKGGLFVAERIRKAVEKSVFNSDGYKIRLTVSIGVSNCPENAVTIHNLIISADKALYEAKNMGKNKVVASSSKGS
jgi:diguanylate cyclase (GGDEF)-like protein